MLLYAPADASKAFPFQFGSISPGFMNGMAVSFISNKCLLSSWCKLLCSIKAPVGIGG